MIDQLVTELAEKREIFAIRQNELQRLEDHIARIFGERLEKSRQFIREAKDVVQLAEGDLKEAVLDLYGDGKIEKKPHDAVQIKTYTILGYDTEKAKQYCVDHLPGALTMKKSAFEKVAKVAELDFVDIDTEDRVSIKRDLSEWLEKGE